jgi:RNA polymerase sigma-70 factor (ECF subfamily)
MSANEETIASAAFSLDLGVPERDETSDRRVTTDDDFNELYRTYGPLVHGILLARLPKDEVPDILQDVFFAAFRNLSSLRDRKAAGGWLVKIARNHAANYYRRSHPTEELADDLESRNDFQTEAAEVLKVIKLLPEAYCETLVLRLVEGMTGEEIAEQTGRTPESVRVNLHRGMTMLRQKLGIRGKR